MKKIVLSIVVCISFLNALSQDTTFVNFEFMFNPQGSISIQNPQDGFGLVTPLIVSVSIIKGKNVLVPQYILNFSQIGLLYERSLNDNVGVYVFGAKSVLSKGGYSAIGLRRQLTFASCFVELGSTTESWSPDINIGLIIPFAVKLK